ncbi:SAM-dependent DNA methyltransferase [Candidatus Woesearchaeota archaeon]|nr:SAM-dependent DNA methyltransferase [Candidatus Woesearchaeota archaeon]
MSISTTIKSIQDIMRKDAGVDGDAQRISQLVWMIFLKVFDAKEEEWELEDDTYKSPIPERLRWRNWAANDEGITGEELLDFINNKLFPQLKNLEVSADDKKAVLVRDLFSDAYNYMKHGALIRQVINKLNEIDFHTTKDRHLFNDIYEQILRDLQSAGNAGEYYTPRAVTQFIVDMINPKLGEVVLDPACGTGGFLICTLENLKKVVKSVDQRAKLQDCLRGIEKKPLPHLLATTNLILHDIEVPNIKHDNSLSKPIRDIGPSDQVDIVVTNPPFGGAEEEGIENNFPSLFRTRETADLFLVLIMRLLRDEGRCGIVLPSSPIDEGKVKGRIFAKLFEEFNLHTIVRLPQGVFSPYTDISTNLLFFEKGKQTKDIWYFFHPIREELTHLNNPRYSKTKPIRIEEFELEKEWWNNRNDKKFSNYCIKISADEIIKRRYDLWIENPNNVDETENMTSKEIIERLEKSINKNVQLLEKIKRELK